MGKIINVTIHVESDAIGYLGEDAVYYGWCPWKNSYAAYISEEEYEDDYEKHLTAKVESILKRAIAPKHMRRQSNEKTWTS